MIVVDTNVLAYLWLPGERTTVAQAVWDVDSDWHVPALWRSEMRNILLGYLRRGALDYASIAALMLSMEQALEPSEHIISSPAVLALARDSACSAYDCEFVALAEALNSRLVTEDRQVLAAFPKRAWRMAAFLAGVG